jgi:hypothetical protein
MSENATVVQTQAPQKHGRTFADLFVTIILPILLIVGIGVILYFGSDKMVAYIKMVPVWIWTSLLLSVIWYPFLVQRAKEDAKLFLVTDGPQRLTEYRVGRRVPLDLDGMGVPLMSKSGTMRTLLTELDPISLKGRGSELAEFTQFEMARDLGTLHRLSMAFSEHLRSERITKETMAVEVEKQVKILSERWVGIAMSTLEPEELETALSITRDDSAIDSTVEEMVDFETP